MAYEAMECHGGNGYVDEAPIARLFRQAPLNAIWEGSGNVSLGPLSQRFLRIQDTLVIYVKSSVHHCSKPCTEFILPCFFDFNFTCLFSKLFTEIVVI